MFLDIQNSIQPKKLVERKLLKLTCIRMICFYSINVKVLFNYSCNYTSKVLININITNSKFDECRLNVFIKYIRHSEKNYKFAICNQKWAQLYRYLATTSLTA